MREEVEAESSKRVLFGYQNIERCPSNARGLAGHDFRSNDSNDIAVSKGHTEGELTGFSATCEILGAYYEHDVRSNSDAKS